VRFAPQTRLCVVTALLALATACKFPYPADVRDDDASSSDARGVDARPDAPVDAAIDARVRTHPLVENNQAADLVIGQRSFTSEENLPVGPQSVVYGMGIAGDPNNIWIADTLGLDRAIRFSPFPASNFPSAVGVVGRADFTTAGNVGAPTSSNLSSPDGIAVTADTLWIVDGDRNRVLGWRPRPTTNGAPANIVLGQSSFVAAAPGVAADKLSQPSAIWTDGVRLVVGDRGNHRVLVWNTIPVSNGQPADVVIGQANFNSSAPPAAPSATRLRSPSGITSDGNWLAVADEGHRRILIWRAFPTSSGVAADIVIGQDSFDLAIDGSASAQRLDGVKGLATVDGALFVADRGHERVLVFDPIPTNSVGDVSTASRSLGQVNPGVLAGVGPITERSLNIPNAIAVVDRYLFVAEWSAQRVLRFRLDLP